MKPTFTERKALMQLRENPFLSADAVKSKRTMALIERLEQKGWVAGDPDDASRSTFEVTEAGLSVLGS